MNNQNEIKHEQLKEMEIQDTELESIVSALRVRTGLRAGKKTITPCV